MSAPKFTVTRTTVPTAENKIVSQTRSNFPTREEAVASIKALGPEINSLTDDKIKTGTVGSTVVCCPTSISSTDGTLSSDENYWEEYKIVYLSYWTGNEAVIVAVHHIFELPTAVASVTTKTDGESKDVKTEPTVASPAQVAAVIMGRATPAQVAAVAAGVPAVTVPTATLAQATLEEVKKIFTPSSGTKVHLSWCEFCQIHDMVCNIMGGREHGELAMFCHGGCVADPTRSDLIGLQGYISFRCNKNYPHALERLSLAAKMGSLLAMKNLIDLCAETGTSFDKDLLAAYQATLDKVSYCSSTQVADSRAIAPTPTETKATSALAALEEVKKIYSSGTEAKLSWAEANRIGRLIRNTMGAWERGDLNYFCVTELAKDPSRSDLICLQGYILFRCDKDYTQACEKLDKAAAMGNLLAMKNLLDLHYETDVDNHVDLDEELVEKYEKILSEANYCAPATRAAPAAAAGAAVAPVAAPVGGGATETTAQAALNEIKNIYSSGTEVKQSWPEAKCMGLLIRFSMGPAERDDLQKFCHAGLMTNPDRSDLMCLMGYIDHRCNNLPISAHIMLSRAAAMGNLLAMKNLIDLHNTTDVKVDEELLVKYQAALDKSNYCSPVAVAAAATPVAALTDARIAVEEVKNLFATKGEAKISWAEAKRINNLISNVMGAPERSELMHFCNAIIGTNSDRSDLMCLLGYMAHRCMGMHSNALSLLSKAAAMGNLLAMKNLIDLCAETGMSFDKDLLVKYRAALTEAKYCE